MENSMKSKILFMISIIIVALSIGCINDTSKEKTIHFTNIFSRDNLIKLTILNCSIHNQTDEWIELHIVEGYVYNENNKSIDDYILKIEKRIIFDIFFPSEVDMPYSSVNHFFNDKSIISMVFISINKMIKCELLSIESENEIKFHFQNSINSIKLNHNTTVTFSRNDTLIYPDVIQPKDVLLLNRDSYSYYWNPYLDILISTDDLENMNYNIINKTFNRSDFYYSSIIEILIGNEVKYLNGSLDSLTTSNGKQSYHIISYDLSCETYLDASFDNRNNKMEERNSIYLIFVE